MIVAWTWRTPAWTAAIEFATASSASLWVWIPQVTAGAPRVRAEGGLGLAEDLEEASGERPAVRVAQDERPRPGVAGRPQRRQGVAGIGRVPVEEVLGVVDQLPASLDDEADAVGDHVEVLRGRRAQDLGDVEEPALPEDRHDRGLGADELLEVRGPPPRCWLRWRVDPNAASRAVRQVIDFAARKNSMSLGLEPGQPPSM